MTPTALTLRRLRQLGYACDVVERWLPRVNVHRDLFGFGDVLAVHRRDGFILIVQATSAAHAGDRLKKARGRPELALWLKAGGRFEVWGWGKRNGRWRVNILAVRPEDLAPGVLTPPPRRGRRPRQRELFD